MCVCALSVLHSAGRKHLWASNVLHSLRVRSWSRCQPLTWNIYSYSCSQQLGQPGAGRTQTMLTNVSLTPHHLAPSASLPTLDLKCVKTNGRDVRSSEEREQRSQGKGKKQNGYSFREEGPFLKVCKLRTRLSNDREEVSSLKRDALKS